MENIVEVVYWEFEQKGQNLLAIAKAMCLQHYSLQIIHIFTWTPSETMILWPTYYFMGFGNIR